MEALLNKLEDYGFECEAGTLKNSQHWIELRAALASAPSEQDKLDAERLDFIEQQGNAFSWGVREHTEPVGSYVIEFGDGLYADGTNFREAIDAAIKKGEV